MVDGPLWRAYGSGSPVTLVVPGLAATEGEARIPASGLPGTRVVMTLPGHGTAPDPPPEYWTYGRVAEDVLAVANEVGATRAIGVSLGSGALIHVVSERPSQFERLALLLPAVLDRPRDASAMHALARAAGAADPEGLRALVAAEIPPAAEVGDYVHARVAALLRLGAAVRSLSEQTALSDAGVLAGTISKVLVVGASDDPRHPPEVAEDTAAAFPDARLEILPSRAPMLTHRRELRDLLRGFFPG